VPQGFRTPRANYRLFIERSGDEVGTSEDLDVRGAIAREINSLIQGAYDAPLAKRHLQAAVRWRTTWQRGKVARIAAQYRSIRNRNERPTIPLRYFIVGTISEYLEAGNDLKAITIRAKILDIAFHLLRALFGLVFLESLASKPRRRLSPLLRHAKRRSRMAADNS